MEHLHLLRKLGMTEYEARAYISLAKLGPCSVREIVRDSNLPRNKAYEALGRLELKRKVEVLPFSPRKYKVVDPEMFRSELEEMNKSLASLTKLVQQPRHKEFQDLFSVLKGKRAVEEKLAAHNGKAAKEILSCNTLSKVLYANIRSMRLAVRKGVRVKMLCPFDPRKKEVYRAWLEAGVAIRVFDEAKFGPLPRITVFDSSVSRLTIGAPEIMQGENYITFWTQSDAFSHMLRTYFLTLWKKAKPLMC